MTKNHPNADNVDPRHLAISSAVAAFYASCHLPQPRVVTSRSVDSHRRACSCFERNGNVFANLVSILVPVAAMTMILLFMIQAIQMDMNTLKNHGVQTDWDKWYWGYPILFATVGMDSPLLFALYMIISHQVLVNRRQRRNLLTLSGGLPTRDKALFRNGALATQLTMIGAMVSAMRSAAANPQPDDGISAGNWFTACLKLGSGPGALDGEGAFLPSLKSIQDYINVQCGRTDVERLDLPEVIQRACDLALLVDEVVLLDGVALVLTCDDLTTVAPQPSQLVGGYDLRALPNAQQLQCRRALGRHGDTAAMLRRVSGWTDIVAADIVYSVVGLDQVVQLLKIRPVASDASGELYRIGSDSSVVCAVRVHDKVEGEDGNPLVHWLKVPQHVASPREGVAWSYGLSQHRYQPTVEA